MSQSKPSAHSVLNGTALSPCCGAAVHWEQFQGMRMVRERDGRNCYQVECSKCHERHELDGGPSE